MGEGGEGMGRERAVLLTLLAFWLRKTAKMASRSLEVADMLAVGTRACSA